MRTRLCRASVVAGATVLGCLAAGGNVRATFSLASMHAREVEAGRDGGLPSVRPQGVASEARGSGTATELPRPSVVVFDLDLSADQVPTWHVEEPRGVARVRGELIVADAQRHHLVNLDTLETIGREGSAEGEFRDPHGIAVGEWIYVADTGNHRIQKFNLDWEYVDAWGSYGTEAGQMVAPEGVAIASDGSVLVTDTGNGRVQRLTSDGDFAVSWMLGAGEVPMVRPTGVAFAAGEVFVSDAGSGLIQRFSLDGESLGVFAPAEWHDSASMVAVLGRSPSGPLDNPAPPLVWVGSEDGASVAGFDMAGNRVGGASVTGLTALGGGPDDVLVASRSGDGWSHGSAAVYSLTAGDEPGRARGSRDALWAPAHGVGPYIQPPTDADVAPDGSIVVSSWAAPGVKRFWENGRPAGAWDSPGWRSQGDPECMGPSSVSVADDGTVFVANVCGGSVERWSLAGELLATWPLVADGAAAEVSAVAAMPGGGAVVADGIWDQIVVLATDGSAGVRFGGSGSEPAELRLPRWSETTAFTGVGLDTDAQGRIYVSDEGNGRVKVFDREGAVVSVIIPDPDREYLKRYAPGPLSVAGDGTFYLSDAYGDHDLVVQRFALDGTALAALVVRCSDALDRPGCVVPFGNEWDDPSQRPVIAATNDGGMVGVSEDGLYWYGALGGWQGHVRDTRIGELPTAALSRALAVNPNGGAMIAAEGRGLVSVSAEGAVTSRRQDTAAPAEIVPSKYRTVPLEHPVAVAVTAQQTSFVLDLFGRLMLIDEAGRLLKLLQPNTNGDVLGHAALRGSDGRIYIHAAHPPLYDLGFLVYSEEGALLDTITTGTSGDDVAIGPDGVVYYAASNGILAVRPGTDPMDVTSIDPGPDRQLVSVAVDQVHTAAGADYVVWAADTTGSLVRYAPDGTLLDDWDGSAAGGGSLSHPSTVRVAPDGSVWVLYDNGRRLRAYAYGAPGGWRTTYHHGTRAQGAPIFAERLDRPAANWGSLPPARGLLRGQWSARSERWMELAPGEQSFHVTSTGGARLWVGDHLALDASARDAVDEVAQVTLPGGLTRVVLEYSHQSGDASFQLDAPVETLPTATPPQPTPRASSTPDAPAPRDGKTAYLPLVRRDLDPPFVDRFDDPNSGWPEVNTPTTLMEYRDGEYRIVNRTADTAAYVISDIRRKNLDVQISARSAGSERGFQGLVFGAEVTGLDPLTVATQFLFVVQPEIQQWGLFLCTDSCGRVQLGNSRNIRKDGGPNTLRVTWQKPWLRIYLNGDRVWQRFQGPYNPDLYHGLVAGPVDAGHDARFDDYIVAEAWEEPAISEDASGSGSAGTESSALRWPNGASTLTGSGRAMSVPGRPWLQLPAAAIGVGTSDD